MTVVQHTISPVDGSVYVERALASPEDIATILSSAKLAQEQWKQQTLESRKDICIRAMEWVDQNRDVIAQELCWQMGRPIRYAKGEVDSLLDRASTMVEFAEQGLQPIQVSDKPGFTRFMQPMPLGTVLVIAPWNYPLHTPINSVIPALLAGNTVILKHSAQTPLCAERLVEAFQSAGVPKGVFQCIHMSHESTEHIIGDEFINGVIFTGSVAAGKRVEQAAAGRFIPVGLELGGKDPAYVRWDANIERAVEDCVDGAFFNSGQSCCAIERIYVHGEVYDQFVKQYIEKVKQYVVGLSTAPETTLGPLIKPEAVSFVQSQVSQALALGAVQHIDAAQFSVEHLGPQYMAPQVLTNVDHSMRVMTEETFGPVVGIMRVESDDAAVQLMNSSEYGLSAAVFTQDLKVATELGTRIQTGTFFVNRCDYLDPELAWTGVKNTGRGCSLSIKGFDLFVKYKSFHIRH